MTEIAAIFHWPLAEMEAMDLEELDFWARQAVSWFDRVNGGKA